MKFELGRTFTLILSFTAAMFAGSAQAENGNTYLYIAHAVSGRNFSAIANPELPVDIKVNGVCVAKGISFGDINGPYSAPASRFTFDVSMANTGSPCTNTTIYSTSATLSAGTTYLGVLTLDAGNELTAQLYEANLFQVPFGQSRILVANATTQDLNAVLTTQSGGGAGSVNVPASSIREGIAVAGLYTSSIYLDSSNTWEAGPVNVQIGSRNVYIYVLAGSASTDSVQIIGPKVIRDVF